MGGRRESPGRLPAQARATAALTAERGWEYAWEEDGWRDQHQQRSLLRLHQGALTLYPALALALAPALALALTLALTVVPALTLPNPHHYPGPAQARDGGSTTGRYPSRRRLDNGWSWHDCHQHWHYDNYAHYALRDLCTDDTVAWEDRAVVGHKNGW